MDYALVFLEIRPFRLPFGLCFVFTGNQQHVMGKNVLHVNNVIIDG